jgi:hypothetical protein
MARRANQRDRKCMQVNIMKRMTVKIIMATLISSLGQVTICLQAREALLEGTMPLQSHRKREILSRPKSLQLKVATMISLLW